MSGVCGGAEEVLVHVRRFNVKVGGDAVVVVKRNSDVKEVNGCGGGFLHMSNDTTFNKRTNEQLTYLTTKGYKRNHVRYKIRKASTTTRQDSLKTKQKRHNNNTVCGNL